MKTKLVLMVFAGLWFDLLCMPQKAEAQITDTCMCPPLSYPPTGQIINLDSSIVVDTCGIMYKYSNCDSAFWFNLQSDYGEQTKKRIYSKGFWEILFSVPAIPIPAVSNPDTIIYVDWTAIDTAYPEIRNTFKQMEENFGDLYFRKLSPTAGENAKRFRLYFTNYVNIDTITKIGRQIPGIIVFDFGSWPPIEQNNINDENINDDFKTEIDAFQSSIKISSNNNFIIKNIEIYNVLGDLLYYYNCPSYVDNNNFTININKYSSGIYIIAINKQTYKFYIVR